MGYIIREVKDNLKRYKFSNQVCIWSITMTMLIIGIFLLFAVNLQIVINDLRERVEIVVFLKSGVDSRRVSQLKAKINRIDNVKSVKYSSPEEALIEFTMDSDLRKQIEFIGENPLPASFSVHLDLEYEELMERVAGKIEKYDSVDEVRYGKEEVNNITKLVNTVKFSGLVLVIIVGIMTMTIIGYTIHLAVHLRGQEIRVMKLVGATAWFIRLPFLIEGILQGCVGGLLSAGLLYVVYRIILTKLEGIVFLPLYYLAVMVIVGMVFGLAGNFIGIGSHIREGRAGT